MITKVLQYDVAHLNAFINAAYRGESSKKGWTTEADLLGGQRIDPSMILAMINSPRSAIWQEYQNQVLQGCVYLSVKSSHFDKNTNCLYLGLLTVRPDLQGSGIGKKLLKWAEIQARALHLPSIEMTVITRREELLNWYGKHGYTNSNQKVPFPVGTQYGLPKMQLEMAVLFKSIPLTKSQSTF